MKPITMLILLLVAACSANDAPGNEHNLISGPDMSLSDAEIGHDVVVLDMVESDVALPDFDSGLDIPDQGPEMGHPDDAPYDLGPLPFEIHWPVEPVITSEETVSTQADLEASLAVAGRRTIVEAGDYGNVAIHQPDQELILQEGVSLGFVVIDAQRVRIEGTPHRGHTIRAIHAWFADNEDLMFKGVNIVSQTTGEDWQEANNLRGTRIAVLHSYIDMVGHAMFMGDGGNSHVIVADTYVRQHRGQQAGPRIHDASYLVFVDSRFENDHRQSWRLHIPQGADARFVVLSRNRIVGSGIQLRPDSGAGEPDGGYGEMADIWIEDNVWHHDRNVVMRLGNSADDPPALRVTFRNNTLYSDINPSFPAGDPSWTVEGNTGGPYEPAPPWVFVD